MLAIIQAQKYQQYLDLQAQKLNDHLATLEVNKRREYLRQASILAGQQSKKRSEEFSLHMLKVIKKLYGNRKPNISKILKLLHANGYKTINNVEFSESTLYKLIRKINNLYGRSTWLEK